jgi:gluconokinase
MKIRMVIAVVMGVSGTGKSTVARLLADRLHCPMLEADHLHSAANIERMASGIALQDVDRRDWLDLIAARIATARSVGQSLIVACSALKRRYRDVLRRADPDLNFVHLVGERTLIEGRLRLRRDHFMPPALLASQFEALEMPDADERVITCDISLTPQAIVTSILAHLGPASESPR